MSGMIACVLSATPSVPVLKLTASIQGVPSWEACLTALLVLYVNA